MDLRFCQTPQVREFPATHLAAPRRCKAVECCTRNIPFDAQTHTLPQREPKAHRVKPQKGFNMYGFISTHNILAFGRWVNLWPPEDVVESYTPVTRTIRLEDSDDWSVCSLIPAGSSDIGTIVFIGNLVLFAVILLALFFLHILLASGLEAYWLTKVTVPTYSPLHVVPRAQCIRLQ